VVSHRFITVREMRAFGECPWKYGLMTSHVMPAPTATVLWELVGEGFSALLRRFLDGFDDADTPASLLDKTFAISVARHAETIMAYDHERVEKEVCGCLVPVAERMMEASAPIDQHMTPGSFIVDFAHRLKGGIPAVVWDDGVPAPVCLVERLYPEDAVPGPLIAEAMGRGLLCAYAHKTEICGAYLYHLPTGAMTYTALESNKERTKELLAMMRACTALVPRHESCKECEYAEKCEHVVTNTK